MKTQCPACKAKQDVPETYVGKQIKCLKCKRLFVATEYKPVVIPVQPKPSPKKPEPAIPESGWSFYVFGGIAIAIAVLMALCSESGIIFITGVGGGFILIGLGAILGSLRRMFEILKIISDKLEKK